MLWYRWRMRDFGPYRIGTPLRRVLLSLQLRLWLSQTFTQALFTIYWSKLY